MYSPTKKKCKPHINKVILGRSLVLRKLSLDSEYLQTTETVKHMPSWSFDLYLSSCWQWQSNMHVFNSCTDLVVRACREYTNCGSTKSPTASHAVCKQLARINGTFLLAYIVCVSFYAGNMYKWQALPHCNLYDLTLKLLVCHNMAWILYFCRSKSQNWHSWCIQASRNREDFG
jgi:hypothetical protein